MNKKNISREGAKTRRIECIRHTRAGGYPGLRQTFIQQLVGQLAVRFYLRFMQGALAQIINSIKVQQPAALFPAIQTGRRL